MKTNYGKFKVGDSVKLIKPVKTDSDKFETGTKFTITSFPPKTFLQSNLKSNLYFVCGKTKEGKIVRCEIIEIAKF